MSATNQDSADAKREGPEDNEDDHDARDDIEGACFDCGAEDFAVEEQDAKLEQSEFEHADEIEEVLDLYSNLH